MAHLELGDVGPVVKTLQDHLGIPVTGTYGEETEREVSHAQGVLGLPVSGIAYPDTFWKMNLQQLLRLEKGDYKSDAVKQLQIAVGLTGGGIDGDFGDTTYDAVWAFQERFSLDNPDYDDFQVDGVAGPQTLEVLGILGVAEKHVTAAYRLDANTGKLINIWNW